MKIVITYKKSSERCKNKNTRKFSGDKSLLEIAVEHLYKHDVTLACVKSKSSVARAKKLNVDRLDLPEETLNGSWSDVSVAIAKSANTDIIGFLFCTNPTFLKFNSVNEFIEKGEIEIARNKSSMVVYPFQHYVMDHKMKPLNHLPGSWHQYSQKLAKWYINPWALIINTKENILKYQYWYCPNVVPLEAKGPCLDIDTEEEFKLSQIIFNSY